MNKKVAFVILIIVLLGTVAFLVLSKKFAPDQPQTNNFQDIQNQDVKALTDIARSYLQKNGQQIYLYVVQNDNTISLDTGIPVSRQDKSIENLNIDWKWFINHNPDYIIDAWQPPYPPGMTIYRPDNRYVVQWGYNKYTITVKIDKNFNAQSTEIEPNR